MPSPSVQRTNIFGATPSSIGVDAVLDTSDNASIAGQLIDKLKFIADSNLNRLVGDVEWVGIAADSGQNEPDGLVNKEMKAPDHIDPSTMHLLTPPTMPALPPFPALPSNLTFDVNALKGAVLTDITNLQTTWMAKFLPDPTDVSSLDVLFNNILNGSNEATVKGYLDTLENDLQGNLTNITTQIIGDTDAQTKISAANLTNFVTGLPVNINAAIALATANIAAIAVARARDVSAREGARIEAETISDLASRGFALPSGILTAQQQAARQATLSIAATVAGEQSVKSQVQYLELAKMSVDAWVRESELQIRSEIEFYRTFADTRMRNAQMQMEADRAKVKQALDHIGLRLDFTRFAGDLAVKYRLGVAQAMDGLIQAYAALNRNETLYLETIANAQRANLAALVEYFRMGIQQADISLRANLANNDNDLKFINTAAQFIGTAVGHHVQAAMSSLDANARVAASALSGLNAVIQQSSTG